MKSTLVCVDNFSRMGEVYFYDVHGRMGTSLKTRVLIDREWHLAECVLADC